MLVKRNRLVPWFAQRAHHHRRDMPSARREIQFVSLIKNDDQQPVFLEYRALHAAYTKPLSDEYACIDSTDILRTQTCPDEGSLPPPGW